MEGREVTIRHSRRAPPAVGSAGLGPDDCLITGCESLIDALNLPDPDDRHVLAAAITGCVDISQITAAPYFRTNCSK